MRPSANICHESDSEHPLKVASRKHSIYTHFPKDRICEVYKRTKITRAPCRRRNGEPVSRAEKCGDLITADHKVVSDGGESRNSHRYAVVVQDSVAQRIQSYPCKPKTEWSLRMFLEPSEKPKVSCTDNSLKFGKACEDLSWNHRTSTPHRSETLDENGSLILWNAIAICEMIKTSWQVGKHIMKGASENHFVKARPFRLVQWLNIIRFLRETSQGSTNLVRKFYLEYSSAVL